jgi:hypothetical protein
VSCVFCILSSGPDLAAATRCADNFGVYRELVRLDAKSTFSFQAGYRLADVVSSLLSSELQESVAISKVAARIREDAEMEMPKHLLYEKGWPKQVPTWSEALLLAQVRRTGRRRCRNLD